MVADYESNQHLPFIEKLLLGSGVMHDTVAKRALRLLGVRLHAVTWTIWLINQGQDKEETSDHIFRTYCSLGQGVQKIQSLGL